MADPYVTNRGKMVILGCALANVNTPSYWKLALCTAGTTPTVDTNTLSQLTEIAVGNGYSSGGATVARDTSTGWDTLTEDDSNDLASIQLQDVTWSASGGPIPASGDGARYAVLTDDSGNVICWVDFVTARVVSDGQDFEVKDFEIQAVAAS